jgi:predicted Zn-dependent peptidase
MVLFMCTKTGFGPIGLSPKGIMPCHCLCVGLHCTASCAAALQRAGGVGLNASTSHDATKYYVSLPQNKLEVENATILHVVHEPTATRCCLLATLPSEECGR